jgi:hypothetical protein
MGFGVAWTNAYVGFAVVAALAVCTNGTIELTNASINSKDNTCLVLFCIFSSPNLV